MKALVYMGILACASGVAHATTADTDEEPVVLVGPSRQECYRGATQEAQWTIKGEVEVGEVLHVLSRLACERYLVTRELMRQRVTIGVSSEKLPVRELRSRVIGALRANGIAVNMDMSYHVTKGDQDHDSFGGLSLPPPSPTPAPVLPTQAVSSDELDKAIHCERGRCEITRAVFDRILGDSTGMAQGARLVPSIKDGMPNGFKLYAIRPRSYFDRVGLQNGDTILTLNGMDITSPDKALEAYAKIRKAARLTLQLMRRGLPVTQEIVIK